MSKDKESYYAFRASANSGMSLRAYLAGQCIDGLLSTYMLGLDDSDIYAEEAVKIADKLIEELNK